MLTNLLIALGLTSCCAVSISAASLSYLSQPEIKAKLIKAKLRHITKKPSKAKPAIKTAILIELPSQKSLLIARSPSEIQMLDQRALELLFHAALAKNPELSKANKMSKKTILGRGKEEALELIESTKLALEQEYRIWRSYYQERYRRDHQVIQAHELARQNLISMSDQASLLEVESIIKGKR